MSTSAVEGLDLLSQELASTLIEVGATSLERPCDVRNSAAGPGEQPTQFQDQLAVADPLGRPWIQTRTAGVIVLMDNEPNLRGPDLFTVQVFEEPRAHLGERLRTLVRGRRGFTGLSIAVAGERTGYDWLRSDVREGCQLIRGRAVRSKEVPSIAFGSPATITGKQCNPDIVQTLLPAVDELLELGAALRAGIREVFGTATEFHDYRLTPTLRPGPSGPAGWWLLSLH